MTLRTVLIITCLGILALSCGKNYKCGCDADGTEPFQNDFIYEVEANSKEEAKEMCREYGDECGLYPT